MATAENRSPVRSGALDNAEAASLIEIILANTSTSAPPKVTVPDSPKSLSDYFPDAVLARAA